jgi:hypothetical protein
MCDVIYIRRNLMNRMQKMAWWFLITGVIAIVLCSAAYLVLYLKYGAKIASTAIAFLGIFGIAGFAQIFIKKDSGKVTYDERDQLIYLQAGRAMFAIFFIAIYLLSFVAVPILHGKNGSLPVKDLWLLTFIASVPAWLAWAITILAGYGWKEKVNE